MWASRAWRRARNLQIRSFHDKRDARPAHIVEAVFCSVFGQSPNTWDFCVKANGDIDIQRYRDTETQTYRDTETQRHTNALVYPEVDQKTKRPKDQDI
jgi:hypothetical protein